MHPFFQPIFVISFHSFHFVNQSSFHQLAVQMNFMLFLLFCFIGCLILYVIIRILIKLLRCHKSSRSTLECPFAVKWEIDEEELVDSENGYLKTEWFNASNIPGIKYFLAIFPNGYNEKTRGETLIFFTCCIGKETNVKAVFHVSIESAGYSFKLNHVFINSDGKGVKCCTTNDLFYDPRFIVNEKLSIKCEGTLSVERTCEPAEKANEKWQKENFFGNLWNGKSKNFAIVVDGKTLQVHKNVLAARSPVFEAMFNAKMKESIENQMEIIDFDYETVEAAIQLMYERKISTLKMKEKMALVQFFDKYAILDLKDSLESSLTENISLTSVCNIATFSLLISSVNLQKRCHDYMVASIRMNRTITDFEVFDEDLAHKILKDHFHHVVKT